jgi:hypothetical protein
MNTLTTLIKELTQQQSPESQEILQILSLSYFEKRDLEARLSASEVLRIWTLRVQHANDIGKDVLGWKFFCANIQSRDAGEMVRLFHFYSSAHLITAFFEETSEKFIGAICLEKSKKERPNIPNKWDGGEIESD